jgi:hypothetical protein
MGHASSTFTMMCIGTGCGLTLPAACIWEARGFEVPFAKPQVSALSRMRRDWNLAASGDLSNAGLRHLAKLMRKRDLKQSG